MSDLLNLAARLRSQSDESLATLVRERQLNTSNMRDFFDFAEQLLASRNLTATIASLPARQIAALESVIHGAVTTFEATESERELALRELARQQLIYTDSLGVHTYPPVAETLRSLRDAKLRPTQRPTLLRVAEYDLASDFSLTGEQFRATLSQAEIDRDCGVAMFEAMQAVTELAFYLEQHFVREVGKGNVGLPDLKRFANRLNKTNDYARQIFELANMAEVAELADGRWQLGAAAADWIRLDSSERWQLLARAWRGSLGESACDELLAELQLRARNANLNRLLQELYPLADKTIDARVRRTIEKSNLVGLTDQGALASWTVAVLAGDFDTCLGAIQQHLPAFVSRLIVQADLSVVAPGPLPTALEMELREFADCEQIGFATTYRLSALTITLGLEHGLTVGGIRDLLVRLSGKELPQPVEYLLRESQERFGRLVVHTASVSDHSILSSADPILLKAIQGNPAMKPFGLVETTDQNLACQFEAEVLYFGLREAGYPAIRAVSEATSGRGGSPLRPGAIHADLVSSMGLEMSMMAPPPLQSVHPEIELIRRQDSKPGTDPDSDDVTRQIQLAIKNKIRLNITVTTDSGATHEFLLEPTGIANGRLRAKDRKADIERTLPLANITSVTLA